MSKNRLQLKDLYRLEKYTDQLDVRFRVQYYLSRFGVASKQELYDVCSKKYYNNGMKHFGDILSRMVKKGDIKRVKKGWYSLPEPINAGRYIFGEWELEKEDKLKQNSE